MDNNTENKVWRNVSDKDIEMAIEGTLLGQMYKLLQKNYDVNPPVSLCLTHAIVNVAMALVHKKEWYKNNEIASLKEETCLSTEANELIEEAVNLLRDEQADNRVLNNAKLMVKTMVESGEGDLNEAFANFDVESEDISKVGELFQQATCAAKRSGIYIDTKTGNVPNVFALVVAPSGFGKSLSLSTQIARVVGYTEVSETTLAGIYGEACKGRPILLSFQEFGKYLNTEWAVSEFRTKLTDMFSAGSFYRTKGDGVTSTVQACDWFYPSLLGSVQPAVLKKRATLNDIAQGFLPRMLIAYIDETVQNTHVRSVNICEDEDFCRIIVGLVKLSRQDKVFKLPDPDYNIKFSSPIEGELSPSLKPFLNRYAGEYLPRIALMLSIPENYNGEPLQDITLQHMEKATIIMHHYLHNVEKALYGLNDLTGKQKLFEIDIQKMTRLLDRLHKKRKKSIKLTDISHASSGTGWDSLTRIEILNEMLQRDMIKLDNRKNIAGNQIQKGDWVCLDYNASCVNCTLGINKKS